jgi:hypothetical protein
VTRLYRIGITVFGIAFVGIGFALLIVTALHGGGAVGFLLGALFIAAGAGRLYLLRRGAQAPPPPTQTRHR